jgi:hypothetical protein
MTDFSKMTPEELARFDAAFLAALDDQEMREACIYFLRQKGPPYPPDFVAKLMERFIALAPFKLSNEKVAGLVDLCLRKGMTKTEAVEHTALKLKKTEDAVRKAHERSRLDK